MLERHHSTKGIFSPVPLSSSRRAPAAPAASPSVLPSTARMASPKSFHLQAPAVWAVSPAHTTCGVQKPAAPGSQLLPPAPSQKVLQQHASGKALYKQLVLASWWVDFQEVPEGGFAESSTSRATQTLLWIMNIFQEGPDLNHGCSLTLKLRLLLISLFPYTSQFSLLLTRQSLITPIPVI